MTTQQILDHINDVIGEYTRVMENTYNEMNEDKSKVDKLFHKYNELHACRDALLALYLHIVHMQIDELRGKIK